MPVISISLSNELLRKLDKFMVERGYSSRSEVIRDAVRDLITEYELSKFEEGKVTATITVITDHEKRELNERLMWLRHRYDKVVSADMHIHLGGRYCLEIFITGGDIKDVLDFIGRIRAMRGIEQVKYTMVPLKD